MKILCTNPKHSDSTPSMEVYEDAGYCFSCGWVDSSVSDSDAPKREKEDIGETLGYIANLPRREIRGLQLPFDSTGFYIVWPNIPFYKKRFFAGPVRYLCPRGHITPLLYYKGTSIKTLTLVEGELNAMSLHEALPDLTIASPGSATNFSFYRIRDLTIYDIYCIIVDKDAAGVAYGTTLKNELLKLKKRVCLVATEKDINEILQESGPEGVRTWARQHLPVQ